MKEPGSVEDLAEEGGGGGAAGGVRELRAMALRQARQIDAQQQLLAAKEQRLRYLQQQEARHHQVAAEGERLRRLRERVEAQELKLRRLRALRGHADRGRVANAALTSDLESIRALFNEKEKELSVAVAKVEELTRQLEQLRRGRPAPAPAPAPAAPARELDKLRQELMYRNKVNEQQNARLAAQRSALGARRDEMRAIDRRVAELQARLLRKRAAAPAAPATAAPPPLSRGVGMAGGARRANVAAVEPYNHIPLAQGLKSTHQNNMSSKKQNHNDFTGHENILLQQDLKYSHQKQTMNIMDLGEVGMEMNNVQQGIVGAEDKAIHHNLHKPFDSSAAIDNNNLIMNTQMPFKDQKCLDHQEFVSDFGPSKSDPKYQTLPYNTKFLPNGSIKPSLKHSPPEMDHSKNSKDLETSKSASDMKGVNPMTVHSTPLSVVNKSLATPLNQADPLINTQLLSNRSPDQYQRYNQDGKENIFNQNGTSSTQNDSKPPNLLAKNEGQTPNNLVTNTLQNKPRPVRSVAPARVQAVPPLAPAAPAVAVSPRPALPPKPVAKTPPRQSAPVESSALVKTSQGSDHSSDSPIDERNPGNFKESNSSETLPNAIKARPLTIRKPPLSEQPKLKSAVGKNGMAIGINRRIEMPPAFLFPEMDHLEGERDAAEANKPNCERDETDRSPTVSDEVKNGISLDEDHQKEDEEIEHVSRQMRGVELGGGGGSVGARGGRRVSFDPLALLLDASLEGELDLVQKTATQVPNPSAANDEGITALHNAICAGHFEIVKFLVQFGCDVNAQDSDGWTPLHCAASCNNLPMVRFLVQHGACIFATTLSDHETAAEKCEEDEEGFDGCSEYLYSVQEKLGIAHGGAVFAVFEYGAARADELSLTGGARLHVLRKGDDAEREWWWARDARGREGYVPRNLLGLYPRVAVPCAPDSPLTRPSADH